MREMWAAETIAKKRIPLSKGRFIEKGTKITITRGREYKYALWESRFIYDLPRKYVDELQIKVISQD